MKTLTTFLAMVLVGLCSAQVPKDTEKRLMGLDVDKILDNPRLLSNYIKCLTDEGPCSAEGKQLKENLPEYIHFSCKRCSAKLKDTVRKVMKAMNEKYPEELKKVMDKFDPKGEHSEEVEKFLKGE